jgi:hypothetical protein
MKRDIWLLLLALALMIGGNSCNDKEIFTNPDDENPAKITTYIALDIKGANDLLRAGEDGVNNYLGTYVGWDIYEHIDVYITTTNGNTLLMNQRFNGLPSTDLTFDPLGNIARIAVPFKAAPGLVNVIVVVNGRNPVLPAVPPANFIYTGLYSDSKVIPAVVYGGATVPGSYFAYTQDAYLVNKIAGDPTIPLADAYPGTYPSYCRRYMDHVSMIGTYNNFLIEPNITQAQAVAGANLVTVSVTKTAARAFLTTTVPFNADGSTNVTNASGKLLGTISNLSFALAQTANQAYLFPQTVGSIYPSGYGSASPSTTYSWGFEFVPGASGNDYNTQARTYYDYNDLLGPTRPIPTEPINPDNGTIDFGMMPGEFLAETTHSPGIDATSSSYKKGNTAYFLIRGKFKPDPSTIVGGKPLAADGTFYIGATDQLVYASISDAQDPVIGMANQNVMTYTGGKVLYYLWLNPDQNPSDPNYDQPINSPVVRNNIYHANISGFSSIGYNWNPLVPPGGVNPDPEPNGPEPPSTIDPDDPLSDFNTYMSVQISVLNWGFHSYQIDL